MLGTNELINLYSLDKALKFSFSVSLRRFLGTKNQAREARTALPIKTPKTQTEKGGNKLAGIPNNKKNVY